MIELEWQRRPKIWIQLKPRVVPMSRDRSAANLLERCCFVTNKGQIASKMRDYMKNLWFINTVPDSLDKIMRQLCAKLD